VSARPIVDAVWGTRPEPPRRRLLWAGLVGVGVHAVLLALMWRTGPSLETWAADVAIRVHQELVRVEAVDLEADAPEPEPERQPEPAPEPESKPAPEPAPTEDPPAEPEHVPTRSQPRAKAAPAAAAQPLATEPEGPLDLSDDVIVRGSSSAYAGGATATSGTSREPVVKPAASSPADPQPSGAAASSPDPVASTPAPRRRDRSAPARPRDADWDCRWPRAADALDIDRESATVRVMLDARGRVQSVQIVHDPGHGFGAAAAECARRARFTAARDPQGRRIASRTPPIRVQFTR
jgi:periplasmic protein TonB